MEKEFSEVIREIEILQKSLEKESDFFKKSFISQEIKKLADRRDILKSKIIKLKNLAGEVETPLENIQKIDNKIQEEKGAGKSGTHSLINGPYHENVKVAGGKGRGEIHYFAREVVGSNKVELEYLSPKGKSTGLSAKTVTKEEFLSKFISCIEHGCSIIKQ